MQTQNLTSLAKWSELRLLTVESSFVTHIYQLLTVEILIIDFIYLFCCLFYLYTVFFDSLDIDFVFIISNLRESTFGLTC